MYGNSQKHIFNNNLGLYGRVRDRLHITKDYRRTTGGNRQSSSRQCGSNRTTSGVC